MNKCPVCGTKFLTEKEMFKHFANEHENFTQTLLSLRDSISDWEYFIDSLWFADDGLKTERYYNS